MLSIDCDSSRDPYAANQPPKTPTTMQSSSSAHFSPPMNLLVFSILPFPLLKSCRRSDVLPPPYTQNIPTPRFPFSFATFTHEKTEYTPNSFHCISFSSHTCNRTSSNNNPFFTEHSHWLSQYNTSFVSFAFLIYIFIPF